MPERQQSLFGEPAGRCKTCGAERPADYPRTLFLEPVSGECHDCNHATIAEIERARLAGDEAAFNAAWLRHYPDLARRTRKKAAS